MVGPMCGIISDCWILSQLHEIGRRESQIMHEHVEADWPDVRLEGRKFDAGWAWLATP